MADQHPGGISPLQQMVASGAGAVVTSLFSKTWGGGWAAGDWGRSETGGVRSGVLKGACRPALSRSDPAGRGEGSSAVSTPLSGQR